MKSGWPISRREESLELPGTQTVTMRLIFEEELEAANEEARRQGYEDGADEDEDEDE